MSTFDKREEGFEKKFAMDADQKFKAEARRNRLLGLWAAEKLGITGDAAAAYAKEVVASDFEEAGDADVVRKILADFTAKGIAMAEPELQGHAKLARDYGSLPQVRASEARLSQVFLNLIINAAHALREAGRALHLDLGLDAVARHPLARARAGGQVLGERRGEGAAA